MATMTTTTTTYYSPSISYSTSPSQRQRPTYPRSQTWSPRTSNATYSYTTKPTTPTPKCRPQTPTASHHRSASSTSLSSGWYTAADDPSNSLESIASRLNTYASRFERWLGLCAQNIVMALFRPTPLVIFLFHPIFLLMWCLLAVLWVVGVVGMKG